MKKLFKVLLVLVVAFSVTACKETDAKRFKKEYESLNNKKVEETKNKYRKVKIRSNNSFLYKDASEIIEMINNKESFIVYFGFSECPWCRSVIEELDKASKDLNYKEIYYVDIKNIRDKYELDSKNKLVLKENGTSDYKELIQLLDEVLDKYVITTKDGKEINVGEKRIYAPNIISVSNGRAKKLETGISDKQKDAYQELTDKMKNETYKKFKCQIKCLMEEETKCTSKNMC